MTPRPSPRRQLIAGLIPVLIALGIVVGVQSSKSTTARRPLLASIFQDDEYLLYASTPIVMRTVDTLRSLGVDTLRVTILWRAIAPSPDARAAPVGFDASNPAAYPAANWVAYDRVVELARARHMRMEFNVSAPGPLWAMAPGAPAARYADHWAPSAAAFGRFVAAVGTRYSGHYSPTPGARALPAVRFWSIWNEPNQPGWLAPQWHPAAGGPAIVSAALYRSYADAAFDALRSTGHGPATDTILVGELAPEGSEGPPRNYRSAIPPMPFLRAMYCVGSSYRPLRGTAATAIGCPAGGSSARFVADQPGLFDVTGFAHHPYEFFLAPNVSLPDRSFVPLSDLPRIERGLDAIFSAYGVHRRLPLWLTEYGYETDPPNPYRGVTPRLQSLYLNEGEYMAWRDPRVLGFAQFLLYDALPDRSYPVGSQQYWSTFQTGLEYATGVHKPSFNSYRVPIFLPDPVLRSSDRVLVWAMLRAAPRGSRQLVRLQWRPQHELAYRTLTSAVVKNASGVLVDDARLPGPGVVRVGWVTPGGAVYYSRGVGVRSG